MRSLRSRTRAAAAIAATVVSLAWLVAVEATAATSKYPAGNATDFATGNGGWTDNAKYGGLCVPAVTCPQLSGSYQSGGGADGSGDGYIRTDSGALTVTALLSTSTHTWLSPAFTYNGIEGQVPDNLRFSLGVNPGVTELLNLGVNVKVTARAIALSGGGDRTLIDEVSPGKAGGWKTINGQVGPDALQVGKNYRIEISVSIGGLAAVLPAGSIGFDDVALRATGSSSGNGNGNGNGTGNGNGDGGNGAGGNGNGAGNGSGAALPPPRVIPAGVAYLYRNKLYIRVKCPRAFKPRCRIALTALTKRRHGRKLTPVRRVNLKRGRTGRKVLGVKRPFRARVRRIARTGKRIVVRQKIRSRRGKKRAIRYQRLRVVIRIRK